MNTHTMCMSVALENAYLINVIKYFDRLCDRVYKEPVHQEYGICWDWKNPEDDKYIELVWEDADTYRIVWSYQNKVFDVTTRDKTDLDWLDY